MIVNTPNGTADVASKGTANTALGLGIAGLATSLLGGGASLFNMHAGRMGVASGSEYVTKEQLDLIQQLQAKDTEIASRDSALALKESETYTDRKLVEVYAELGRQINNTNAKIDSNYREQNAINAQQMAYNATANAQIDVLKSQVAGLSSVTKVYIPSTNVCQSSCCGCSSNS